MEKQFHCFHLQSFLARALLPGFVTLLTMVVHRREPAEIRLALSSSSCTQHEHLIPYGIRCPFIKYHIVPDQALQLIREHTAVLQLSPQLV